MSSLRLQCLPAVVLLLCAGTLSSLDQQAVDSKLNATSVKEDIPTQPPHQSDDVKNVSLSSQNQSTEIYGQTDAEELAELSVIDILFRKRRMESYDETPLKEDSAVSVEEGEFVSYEEISSGETSDTGDLRTIPSPITDYLIPPAQSASNTDFGKDLGLVQTTEESKNEKIPNDPTTA